MRARLTCSASLVAALTIAAAAQAQGPVKIGLIMEYSGQFADLGAQMDNGIKLYMKQHGDTVAGRKIELIRRDTGGIAPDIAKRHAQELVVRDNVDILAGFVATPNALAASDVSAQAAKFIPYLCQRLIGKHSIDECHGFIFISEIAFQKVVYSSTLEVLLDRPER